MNKSITTLFLSFCMHIIYAQDPVISLPAGNTTWCPGDLNTYTVNTPGAKQTGCSYAWTVKNGKITGSTTTASVGVTWDDTTGKGTLSVTLSGCSSATNTTATQNYVIRSLKDETPQNLHFIGGGPYDLCSGISLSLQVDKLIVPGTGFLTNITEYEADSYEWTLSNPSDWSVLNNGKNVVLTPLSGCSGGTIKVRGKIANCNTPSYSNYTSAVNLLTTQTIAVTGPGNSPSFNIGCGDVGNVTFSVTPISCAKSYTWNFPSTWNGGQSITTPSNSVTVALPPSNYPVQGKLFAIANMGSCSLESAAFPITYSIPSPPVITGPNTICTTQQYALSGIPSGFTTNWSTGNTNIVTINSSGLATKVADYNSSINAVISKNGCVISAAALPVYVGRPFWTYFSLDGATPLTTAYCGDVATGFSNSPPDHYLTAIASSVGQNTRTTFALENYNTGFPARGSSITATQFYFTTKSNKSNFCISMNASNACGNAESRYLYLTNSNIIISRIAPGSLSNSLSVFPNPVTNTMQVTANSDSPDTALEFSSILYNLDGSPVKSGKSDNGKLIMDVQDLHAGEYYIHIDNGMEVVKKHVHISK